MKFYKYSLIAALALSGAMFSCSDDDDYAPGKTVSGDQVYFPLSQDAAVDIPGEATTIDIDVDRIDDANALTVAVAASITDEDGTDISGVITVPSQVNFAAGETATTLPLAIDFANVEPDFTYYVTLKLDGDYTTPYGASERTYQLTYSPWSEWELLETEAEFVWSVGPKSGSYELPIAVCHSTADPDNIRKYRYAVCDLYWKYTDKEDGPCINFYYEYDLDKTVKIGENEYPLVKMTLLETQMGISVNSGEYEGYALFTDVRSWAIDFGGVAEDRVDAGFLDYNGIAQSYFNPESGTFFVNDCYFIAELPPLSYLAMGIDVLQLPGYKSYYVNFDYTGNYVDTANDIEYAVVSAVKSPDVASYIYDIYTGELSAADVKTAITDLKEAEDPSSSSDELANLTFQLPEDGVYTVVAVGLDQNGGEVCTSSYSFEYETVQGAPKWQSLGYCEYTDGFLCYPNAYRFEAQTFDVEIQESTEFPGYYRLVDPYAQLAELYSGTFTYLKGKHYMYVDATNPTQVNIEESWLGIADADGEFGALSMSYYYLATGNTVADVADAGFFGTLKNDMITFPAGTLGFIQGTKIYTANKDPNNPTIGTENSNPYLGEGTFCIDMSVLDAAAAPKRKINAPVSNFERLDCKPFKSNFKLKTKTVVTDEAINAYRLANPRSLR